MKNWVVEFTNEWKQLSGGCHFYTMTLMNIEFERELMAYGYEFRFILLGLGIYIRYNTTRSNELFEQWEREAEEACEKGELLSLDDLRG